MSYQKFCHHLVTLTYCYVIITYNKYIHNLRHYCTRLVKMITFLHLLGYSMNNIDHTSCDILIIFNIPTFTSQKCCTSAGLKIYL